MANFSDSESRILNLFEKGKQFFFQGKNLKVIFSGKPTSSEGEPKTDIFARCENVDTNEKFDLKISYKQADADFLENKISADRAAQIFGSGWSSIIQRATEAIKSNFESRKLVYKVGHGRTEPGSITLGWKFEFVSGVKNGSLSGIVPLTVAQASDIYAGNNLSESKKNATVNNMRIDNSGVADYILQADPNQIQTIDDVIRNLVLIKDFVATKPAICFACKALNCRTLHKDRKWDGDRPLAVYVNWHIADGKLTPELIFNDPLTHKGNEIGRQLLTTLDQLKVRTTCQLNAKNCKSDIIYS